MYITVNMNHKIVQPLKVAYFQRKIRKFNTFVVLINSYVTPSYFRFHFSQKIEFIYKIS